MSLSCLGAENEPAPNQYSYSTAQVNLMKHFPAHTIQQGRRGGTMMWTQRGKQHQIQNIHSQNIHSRACSHMKQWWIAELIFTFSSKTYCDSFL